MRKDVQLPLCLRCEEIDRFFFVAYYWHSNGGTMSTVHIDTDENLLCVIKGHKKVYCQFIFIIFPFRDIIMYNFRNINNCDFIS